MIDTILRNLNQLSIIILLIHFQLIKCQSLDNKLTLRMLEAQNIEVAPGINYEYIIFMSKEIVQKGHYYFCMVFNRHSTVGGIKLNISQMKDMIV